MENNNLFDFELVKDENCWCVKGYHGRGEDVVFPASYKNKPVKYIVCSISPKQKKKIKRVIIPEGYTYIYDTFSDCKKLTNIELPKSLTCIGSWTFDGCEGLIGIELPKNLTSIGGRAFDGCIGLTNIKLPESLTSIGHEAFKNCTGLTNIKLSKNLAFIGEQVFEGYKNLKGVNYE